MATAEEDGFETDSTLEYEMVELAERTDNASNVVSSNSFANCTINFVFN